MFDFTFHQVAAVKDLMVAHDASNVIGQHVGDKGVIDLDFFNDADERLMHATVSPLGYVRTSPVIGLGAPRHDDLGGEAA